MIDRAPSLDAARAAAAAIAPELEHLETAFEGKTQNEEAQPARTSSSSALAASRTHLVDFLALAVLGLSTNAAKRWGAHWLYTEAEAQAVASATLDVAELYLPELDGPWATLGVVLAGTALPRMFGPKLPPLVELAAVVTPASSTPATPATNGSAQL